MAIDPRLLQQALAGQPAGTTPIQALVADLIAQHGGAGAIGAGAAGALPKAPGAAIERAPSSALAALRNGGLARQVLEGQVLGDPAVGAGVQQLASYTQPAAAAAEQLALPAGRQLALQAAAPALGAAGGAAGAAGGLGGVGTSAYGGAAAAVAGAAAPAAVAASTTARLRAALTPALGKGAYLRAGAYGAAGIYGGQLENKLVGEHNTSGWDEAATGAITGAGLGAAAGSLLPGIGTAVGAGVGAGVGGLVGYFGPKESGYTPTNQELARQAAKVEKMAVAAGLDQDTRTQLALQLQARRETVNDKTKMKGIGAEIQAQIPAIAGQLQAERRQQAQALAMQAAVAPLLQRYLDRTATSARESQVTLNDAANSLPAGLADLYRARGASYVSDADSMNAALAAQALQIPNQQAKGLQDQIRAQVQSQAIAQIAAQLGGARQGGNALDQLLAG